MNMRAYHRHIAVSQGKLEGALKKISSKKILERLFGWVLCKRAMTKKKNPPNSVLIFSCIYESEASLQCCLFINNV